MRYIGPFLRISTLTNENIENQLCHLSKEALKNIIFHSKCGVTSSIKDFKSRKNTGNEAGDFSSFSPLLCLYRKANIALIQNGKKLGWNKEKFKKETLAGSNALMSLSIMELCDHYKKFKDIDNKKFNLSLLYSETAKKQLDFFASNFRNSEGVFVDKKDVSDEVTGEIKFQDKNKQFNFSDQALFMSAYYRYSMLDEKDGGTYKDFSSDILNMFLEYRDELYEKNIEEQLHTSLGINLFYNYSDNIDARNIVMDITDMVTEQNHDFDISDSCLLYINCYLLYKKTEIIKYKEICSNIYNKLIDMYNSEEGMFMKPSDKKEIEYSSDEISLYVICLLLHQTLNEGAKADFDIIADVYKHQLIDSGIIKSWPDAPETNDPERYVNFSMKAEDMLDEVNFRTISMPTPEKIESAPLFTKYAVYNRKKQCFNSAKTTLDTGKNMLVFFTITYLLMK